MWCIRLAAVTMTVTAAAVMMMMMMMMMVIVGALLCGALDLLR
jgi:hypothetical protein